MTPAIAAAQKAKVTFSIHEYDHDPASTSYGEEAASKLGIETHQVFKTLVARLDNQSLAVAVVPVAKKLDLKGLAKVLGAKKAVMAEQKDVERSTGYVLGGVSPLGQRKRLKTVIDDSAMALATIYVSAGRRGLEIELAAEDLRVLTGGQFGAIAK